LNLILAQVPSCHKNVFMNDTTRPLQIGRDLMRLTKEIPALLTRIDEASKMVSEAQRIDLELMGKRIVDRYTKIAEMADAENDDKVFLDQLTASMDGLREEIAQANIILNRLLP
jgi:hypothetical protein